MTLLDRLGMSLQAARRPAEAVGTSCLSGTHGGQEALWVL